MTQLLTSIAEIDSFNPCTEGFERLMKGREGKGDENTLFPISETTDYCTFSDVAWLLRKRGNTEIFKSVARKCAESVKHLDNKYADAATYAATAYAYAYADAAAADAAAYAATAYAATYDAATYDAAYKKQILLNLSFLKESIQEFESSIHSTHPNHSI